MITVECENTACDNKSKGNWAITGVLPLKWVGVIVGAVIKTFCSEECMVKYFQQKMWRDGRKLTLLDIDEDKLP